MALSCSQLHITGFDSHDLPISIRIEPLSQNAFVNIFGGVKKGLLNPLCVQGRSFEENQVILSCEVATLLSGDLALIIQIRFISDEHYHNFGVTIRLDVFQPLYAVLERLSPCDIVNQDGAD